MHTTDNDLRLPLFAAVDGAAAAPASAAPIAVPKWSRARRMALRAVVGVAALLAAIAATGVAYEAIAGTGDLSAYPPAGRLVDVGGYRLHLDCRGEGTPTIVMDAGLGGSSLDWILVQSKLASTTQVCSYDRAGMGWSEPGPAPRSPAHIAEELHLLLANAGVPGPYVLVAHSLAGKNARMFASAYPADVAGMVLVDARSERVDALSSKADTDGFSAALQGQATMYALARRLGIARLAGAGLIDEPLVPPSVATEMVLLQTNPGAIEETTAEGLARSADDAVLATATLGSMPLVVIAAADSMSNTPNWPAAQAGLAALSTKGRLVVAEHSKHYVQLDDPNVVIDSVSEVLASLRNEP